MKRKAAINELKRFQDIIEEMKFVMMHTEKSEMKSDELIEWIFYNLETFEESMKSTLNKAEIKKYFKE